MFYVVLKMTFNKVLLLAIAIAIDCAHFPVKRNLSCKYIKQTIIFGEKINKVSSSSNNFSIKSLKAGILFEEQSNGSKASQQINLAFNQIMKMSSMIITAMPTPTAAVKTTTIHADHTDIPEFVSTTSVPRIITTSETETTVLTTTIAVPTIVTATSTSEEFSTITQTVFTTTPSTRIMTDKAETATQMLSTTVTFSQNIIMTTYIITTLITTTTTTTESPPIDNMVRKAVRRRLLPNGTYVIERLVLRNVPQKSDFQKSSEISSTEKSETIPNNFNVSLKSLKSMNIYSGTYLNAIQFFYLNGDSQVFGNANNQDTSLVTPIDLEASSITQVNIESDPVIFSLKFQLYSAATSVYRWTPTMGGNRGFFSYSLNAQTLGGDNLTVESFYGSFDGDYLIEFGINVSFKKCEK